MFFWIREIAGWILILVSLYLIRMGLLFVSDLNSPKIIEAAVVVVGGTAVLKAGTLLVRLSTIARITQPTLTQPKIIQPTPKA